MTNTSSTAPNTKKKLSTRDQYLTNFFQPSLLADVTGLEIGPYDRAFFPRSSYPKIKYADVFTTEELIERASQNPKRTEELVETVNYVIGEKSIADLVPSSSMEFIFCSHVLEHVPDLIKALQDIESTLTHGGKLLIAYPDKRYTFDVQREETSYAELMSRHQQKLVQPDYDIIYDYFVNYRHVKVGRLWQKMDEAISDAVYTEEYAKLMANLANESYIDAHCNIFSDSAFINIIEVLNKENIVNLEVIDFAPTIAPRNEFLLTLQRP